MEDKYTLRELDEKELDHVTGGVVTETTTTVKVPGPTDFIVTTAENPAGNNPPGHQSTTEVPNRLAK